MKKMMSSLAMKPRDIKMNVENESRTHKYKIIGFSLVMAAISGAYQNYYDMLSWRINQYQAHYMHGTMPGASYNEPDMAQNTRDRNTLAQLRSMGMKETKYILSGWVSGLTGSDYAAGPIGLNTSNNYFTQTEWYTAPAGTSYDSVRAQQQAYVDASSEAYDNWEKMSKAIWFDTRGCQLGGWVWDSNAVTISGWIDGDDNSAWGDSWSTNSLSVSGSWTFANEDAWIDWREGTLDLSEDCDIDCQAAGSQMSLVASLNGTALGIIGLNALFMFIGTWRYRWRVCSVYCTLFACLFQFAVIITTATMLFSKYTITLCAGSLTPTAGMDDAGNALLPWYMADDWAVNVMLWVAQIFLMFGFLACGLCSAMKSED